MRVPDPAGKPRPSARPDAVPLGSSSMSCSRVPEGDVRGGTTTVRVRTGHGSFPG